MLYRLRRRTTRKQKPRENHRGKGYHQVHCAAHTMQARKRQRPAGAVTRDCRRDPEQFKCRHNQHQRTENDLDLCASRSREPRGRQCDEGGRQCDPIRTLEPASRDSARKRAIVGQRLEEQRRDSRGKQQRPQRDRAKNRSDLPCECCPTGKQMSSRDRMK